MYISFFALGSRGDVQPFVALAKGFADAGHEVRFISDESAKPLVTPHGIQGHFLKGNLQERLTAPSSRRSRQGRDPYTLVRALTGAYADVISSWAIEAAEAAQGSKLLIMSNSSFGIGYAIAERIRAIPCEASVLPHEFSRHVPSSLLPWPSVPLPGSMRRLLHEAARRAVWLGARDVVNAARRALKLAEVSWPFGRGRPAFRDAIPQLYGFSPTLIPPAPDWSRNIAVTGFWHHRVPDSWQPSPELASFLEVGPSPVYIGFGSMPDRSPAQIQEIVLHSVRRLRLRAIVAKGWGAMDGVSSADDIFVLDDVPHEWLFPRVRAAIYHGGPGTVGAALRAGTPSVIVPFVVDQPLWGWALERLGVAPRMIPRSRLSADRLTAALQRATTDGVMRKRAKEVSEVIRAENGVRRAVEVIENFLAPRSTGVLARSRLHPSAVRKPV